MNIKQNFRKVTSFIVALAMVLSVFTGLDLGVITANAAVEDTTSVKYAIIDSDSTETPAVPTTWADEDATLTEALEAAKAITAQQTFYILFNGDINAENYGKCIAPNSIAGHLVLDLNCHTVDRGLTEETAESGGNCIYAGSSAVKYLTITSSNGRGTFTGAYTSSYAGASGSSLCFSVPVTVSNIIITGNQTKATYTPGLYVYADVVLDNVTITNNIHRNSASQPGGAMFYNNVTLKNKIEIYDNYSTDSGELIHNDLYFSSFGSPASMDISEMSSDSKIYLSAPDSLYNSILVIANNGSDKIDCFHFSEADNNKFISSGYWLYKNATDGISTANRIYTVTFNLNGMGSNLTEDVKIGSTVTRPEDPSYDGYKFVGWYTNRNLTTAYDFDTVIYGTKTIYAKWIEIIEYNLSLDTNSLIGATAELSATKIEQDDTVTVTITPDADYVFNEAPTVLTSKPATIGACTADENGVYTCEISGITADQTKIYVSGEAKPSHNHDWSEEYTNNDTHHWYECLEGGCDIDAIADMEGYAEHTFGDWEVTTEATYLEPGEKERECSVCGYIEYDEVEYVHEHDWSEEYTNNDTHHWHECLEGGCDIDAIADMDGYAEHTYGDWTVITEATYLEPGEKERVCSVCGYIEYDRIEYVHAHIWATRWSANDTHHWHECLEGGCNIEAIADMEGYEEHAYGDWTVITEATYTEPGEKARECRLCGYIEFDDVEYVHEHDWAEEYTNNDTHHWYECEEDGCYIDAIADMNGYEEHTYGDWTITTKATPEADGEKTRTCECGKVETAVVNYIPVADGDTGGLTDGTKPENNECNADLDVDADDIITDIGLEDDELEAIENGEDLSVYLEVENVDDTIASDDKATLESALKDNMNIGMLLELNLFKKIGSDTEAGVTTTLKPITVTLVIPDELIATDRIYGVIGINADGVAEDFDSTFDAQSKTLTFETDSFTNCAITYIDVTTGGGAPAPAPTPDDDNVPGSDDVIITPDDDDDDTDADGDDDAADTNPDMGVTANFAALVLSGAAILFLRKRR